MEINAEVFAASIKEEARIFTNDNIRNPLTSDYAIIENAMLRGANAVLAALIEKKQ